MHSPRHRWNCVALATGEEPQRDGLLVMSKADKIAQTLRQVVEGKLKVRAYNRALEIYRSESTRTMYEVILFATRSVADTAKILKDSIDDVQVYADCFFDVSVFPTEVERALYLDKLQNIRPQAAMLMRNAMAFDTGQLLFLSNQQSDTKVDAKTAVGEALHLFHNMMKLYIKPQLEAIINEDQPAQQRAHFNELFDKAIACGGMVNKFSEQSFKYELDKDKDKWMEEFALRLQVQTPQSLIADKPREGDGGPEII